MQNLREKLNFGMPKYVKEQKKIIFTYVVTTAGSPSGIAATASATAI